MIPIEIKEEVREIIENYNNQVVDPSYVIHFQEANLFLFRCDDGRINLYAKLAYRGCISNWDCYYYNHDSGKYEKLPLAQEQNSINYVLQYGKIQ